MTTQTLAIGQKIRFAEEKQRYTVDAVSANGRFAICTKPFNLQRTVIYCIVDFERDVRGPDDRIFSAGYETAEQIALNLSDLESGDLEVSRRRSIPLNIVSIA